MLARRSGVGCVVGSLCFGLAVGSSPIQAREIGQGEERRTKAAVTLTSADGTRYQGPALVLQVAESSDPPVLASLSATAPNGAVWNATFGLSIEMLAARSITIEVARRPLRTGAGSVAHGPEGRTAAAQKGRLELKLGKGQTMSGSATLEPQHASAKIVGAYELSCWVRPETIGLRPNGEPQKGAVERVEDESFQSAFCRRFADLR